ncbi:2,4-dienoyl-CoA reductase [Weissella bombi]|uniref:2,4-dienoyl-CoA reductase n=1 Tax=Weissella bombi TaxID=1505725 RepID=A0A1C3Z922_9LACO|nr:2,4-dienoyl-CoA reductase [Weissella bombi]
MYNEGVEGIFKYFRLIDRKDHILKNYSFLKPYTFANGMQIKNRIVMPPMTEVSSFHDGTVTNDEVAYYAKRSGGVGMLITAVANVTDGGKGWAGELSVADDRFIPGLKKIAQAIYQDDTKAILQIFHAGRMTSSAILNGRQPESASAVAALRSDAETPRELTDAEIETIIDAFAAATKRAILAGFDGVELHGANTYLMQQFFSPHSNRRTDKWGGSLEKRMRFALTVIERSQKVIEQYATKPFLLGYRISPEELETPGIRLVDTLKFIDVLADQPLSYMHVSMGDVWQTSLNDKTDKTPVITQIAQVINHRLPIIGVGSLNKPVEVEKVMAADIEFAALGKEMLREPHWVEKVMADDEQAIRYTISPRDLDDLGITPALWQFILSGSLKKHMNITAK